MKRFLMVLMALLLCLPIAACGGGESGNGGGTNNGGNGGGEEVVGKKIVIYVGGSSEYSVVKGSLEDSAIEAVEQKYFEDTQTKLDFEVNYMGLNMRDMLPGAIMGGTQIDVVVSHTKSGSGIDEFLIANDLYYDLADLLVEYGGTVLEKNGKVMSNVTTMEGNIVGLPSVINPYKYGILVRKDYMEQAGYTDDPAKVSEGKVLVDNLVDFTNMCKEMKKITNHKYAITGAIWDIEKALVTGAYADVGYFSNAAIRNASGEIEQVLPGFATDGYSDVLSQEYQWTAVDKILSKDANSMTLDLAESEFISGKTGVFLTDPSIDHLISVARKTERYAESQGKTAEFTVLPPLKATKDSQKKGYVRNSAATFMAGVISKSQNAKEIVKFVNWMYSDEANYRLCKYGVDGVHYINNGDGTYSYPAGKEEYLTAKPYSGILALVDNENISNLRYSGYTEEELRWIAIARDENNYTDNVLVDYLIPANKQMSKIFDDARNKLYTDIAVPAWNGRTDPLQVLPSSDGKTNFEMFRDKYMDEATEYNDWLTNMYKIIMAKNA